MPYVLIRTMHSRANYRVKTAHHSLVGSSPRVLNLSLSLLPGSGNALLLLTYGAGSG